MTRPETCGSTGGAISFWVKVNSCGSGVVLSTRANNRSDSGSYIFCNFDRSSG